MGIVEQYLLQLKNEKRQWRRAVAILTVLSLFVASGVSWNLRMTGITVANGASCGHEEHQHTEECMMMMTLSCGYGIEYPMEDLPKYPLEEWLEEPAEEWTEEPTEEWPEEPTEEWTEEPTEEWTEEPTEEWPEEPTEEWPEEPTEEWTEEPTEEWTEEPTEEWTEEPTEEWPELPIEEWPDLPIEEWTEEPTDEAAFLSASVTTAEEFPKVVFLNTAAATEEEFPEVVFLSSSLTPAEETPTVLFPDLPIEAAEETPAVLFPDLPIESEEDASAEGLENKTAWDHVHTEDCYEIVYQCGLETHIHVVSCFSDVTADLEDWTIWEASLPELTGWVAEDIVLVAQSQLGYVESTLNFELSKDGETRNGITRYGQWYGNPYGDWSNMFTSFCLSYAGFTSAPINSGAETMRLDWEEEGLYRYAGSYEPVSGDIVFLDKNRNGVPESTAVVVQYFDFILTVIEGDVENAVVLMEYDIDDPAIVGYGITEPDSSLMMFAATAPRAAQTIGQTAKYSNNLLNDSDSYILYAAGADGKYYALDGDGNAVEIQIDDAGVITADITDQSMLYWRFEKTNNYDNKPAYYIQNVATGVYLHPNRDNNTYGPLHPDEWESALYTNGDGVRIRGARQDAYVQLSGTDFTVTNTQNNGSTIYFGKGPSQVTLWLDGTNGNIMSYRGSDNTKYTVYSDVGAQLPTQWKSPTKYNYTLAGWVNIKTGDYYQPGDTIYVTENTVLYADWVASTYDIGEYNSYVTDTVSTNDFITTRIFDYSSLINLLSSKVTLNVSSSSHSETWAHVANGSVSYKGQETLDFSFNDHDGSGTITNLNNLNDPNKYTGGTGVYSGIYTDELGDALFSTDNLFDPETGEGIVGKHYLGQGDHLFQINTDPNSEFYGYYYYDAKLNAASYNQTDQRFYVYDYLARTSDSANNNDEGKYSDFLPLNSPYANTNGQTIKTYNYDGDNKEYSGVSHYMYDARYDSDSSSANQVKANLWFGMRVDVQFGLPNTPGERLSTGEYGNKDIYGNEMHFKFTGDDDVWILVDGEVVLDMGGIHQAAEGDINFSTGVVRVNGKNAGTLSGIEPGEHTLSILYLERGSSMSNCAIYFNLAPRFSLTLQKEDVLTQDVLNGAQFAFYHDQACTEPCDLWPSQQSYKNGDEPTNVFTIRKGEVFVWGLSPSQTYYIREVAPPSASGYDPAKGVIRLTLDKNGLNSYSATILEGIDENGNKEPVSHGFTIHGFQIDEENQAAYIVITNAQNWVTETTSVYVEKKWNDKENHTQDSITAYLNVTDPDGTVRRIREITLSEENDWKYTWTNLPMYEFDAETMAESDIPVEYSVSEAYVPGYAPQIVELQNGTYTEESWAESASFKNGEVYVLKTSSGCLSAVSKEKDTLAFVDEATAKESPLALWTATVSSGMVKLTNQEGQSLHYYASGATRYFKLTTGSNSSQNLTATEQSGGFRLAYKSGRNSYYISALNKNAYAEAKTDTKSALTFQLMVKTVTSTTVELDGYGFSITNTPLTSETSLKVTKRWDYPGGDQSLYEKAQVTVKLLANGVDTGRTETISLKSNWTAVFNGLPYLDDDGEPITYTVVERWETSDWIPIYGPVTATGGSIPTYETTVTNTYRWTGSFELPATGGAGHLLLILSGLILVLAPFVYGFRMRRRYRKGASK